MEINERFPPRKSKSRHVRLVSPAEEQAPAFCPSKQNPESERQSKTPFLDGAIDEMKQTISTSLKSLDQVEKEQRPSVKILLLAGQMHMSLRRARDALESVEAERAKLKHRMELLTAAVVRLVGQANELSHFNDECAEHLINRR